MSSGDRAGPFSRSRLTSKSLKLSVNYRCVHMRERAGSGSRDLSFSNRDLGKRAGKCCHANTSARLVVSCCGFQVVTENKNTRFFYI